MNRVDIEVSAVQVGHARTWAYPDGKRHEHYRIPTYRVSVSGNDGSGRSMKRDYEALRFGVLQRGRRQPRVVGLADFQVHKIKAWLPNYTVHSARSNERGAWKVYDNFLVHDGPDDPHLQVYASIGCVEICGGPAGFDQFNDFIVALSRSSSSSRDGRLLDIGRRGKLFITYKKAARPPLTKW